jgi:hypothetical protein
MAERLPRHEIINVIDREIEILRQHVEHLYLARDFEYLSVSECAGRKDEVESFIDFLNILKENVA